MWDDVPIVVSPRARTADRSTSGRTGMRQQDPADALTTFGL